MTMRMRGPVFETGALRACSKPSSGTRNKERAELAALRRQVVKNGLTVSQLAAWMAGRDWPDSVRIARYIFRYSTSKAAAKALIAAGWGPSS